MKKGEWTITFRALHPSKHLHNALHERQEPCRSRSPIFEMGGRCLIEQEDLPDDVETFFGLDTSAHEDVVDLHRCEDSLHIVDVSTSVDFNGWVVDLASCFVDDDAFAPEEEDGSGHVACRNFGVHFFGMIDLGCARHASNWLLIHKAKVKVFSYFRKCAPKLRLPMRVERAWQ